MPAALAAKVRHQNARLRVIITRTRPPALSFFFLTRRCRSTADGREVKDAITEELELELEALDIADEPLELEGGDEAENEELAKKLLDEQGQ